MSTAWHDEAPALPPPRAAIVAALSVEGLSLEAGDNSRPGLAGAIRRTRPAVEQLFAANKVPPTEAYELLLAALGEVPAHLEGAHLDRRLVQEVDRCLSAWKGQAKLWKEQASRWIDLLVQSGIVPKADRATWLRTLAALKR
jgi:hypothetical protein